MTVRRSHSPGSATIACTDPATRPGGPWPWWLRRRPCRLAPPQQEQRLFAEQVGQPRGPLPRRLQPPLIHRQPLLDHIAFEGAEVEEVANGAGVDVRCLVPSAMPGI